MSGLSETQLRYLANAWKCFESEPKVSNHYEPPNQKPEQAGVQNDRISTDGPSESRSLRSAHGMDTSISDPGSPVNTLGVDLARS